MICFIKFNKDLKRYLKQTLGSERYCNKRILNSAGSKPNKNLRMRDKMNIIVTATIKNEGKKVDIESIINTVINDTKKFTIKYKSAKITKDDSDPKKVKYKLDNIDGIANEVVGNVYFIFNDKKLLYVGKAKDLKNRLGQHLINCSSSTSSKIHFVQEYLEKLLSERKPLSLSYCAISIEPEKYYGTVEGMIIDYIHSKKDYFKDNWNLRED